MNISDRLTQLGIELPQAPEPVGNYQAASIAGDLLFVSGQLPLQQGEMIFQGKLGEELSIEQGKKAAELCALNILSQIERARGERRIKNIVRLEGYINADQWFEDHAAVLNGASDFLVKLLPDAASHTRIAVGCSGLPMNAAVELSAVVELTL